MEEQISPVLNTQQDMFNDLEPSPKPEDLHSSVSSILASSIPPAQKPPATLVFWSSQIPKKAKNTKLPRKGQSTKYAKYFKDNEILPILELVEAVEPKTVLRRDIFQRLPPDEA